MLNIVYLIIGDSFELDITPTDNSDKMRYVTHKRTTKVYSINSDRDIAYEVGYGIADASTYSPRISVYPAYVKDCDTPLELTKNKNLYVLLVQKCTEKDIQTVYYAVFVDKNNAIKEGEKMMKKLKKYNDSNLHYSVEEVRYYAPKIYSYDDFDL